MEQGEGEGEGEMGVFARLAVEDSTGGAGRAQRRNTEYQHRKKGVAPVAILSRRPLYSFVATNRNLTYMTSQFPSSSIISTLHISQISSTTSTRSDSERGRRKDEANVASHPLRPVGSAVIRGTSSRDRISRQLVGDGGELTARLDGESSCFEESTVGLGGWKVPRIERDWIVASSAQYVMDRRAYTYHIQVPSELTEHDQCRRGKSTINYSPLQRIVRRP